jgi:hypothetical protein
MYLKLFRQDIKKIFLLSISAKPQKRPKNSRLLPFLTNFDKKLLPLHHRRFKAFFLFFALIFFTLTLATIFLSASFLPCLKSDGERLKVKFWSSEKVKIGRGQQNYRRCHHRLCNDEKKQCNQISNGCPEKIQKKLAS